MDYRTEIIRLYNSPAYQRLSEHYGRRSSFDILGISRKETVHSNFLAWFLDPQGSHGCGSYTLKKFLQVLVTSRIDFAIRNAEAFLPDDYIDLFVTDGYEVRDAEVRTEVVVPGSRGNASWRIDILLLARLVRDGRDVTLPIIIENKVHAQEHSDQTQAYYDWAMREYADESRYMRPLFVFLTPDMPLLLKEGRGRRCACRHYIKTDYQYLVDFVIEPSVGRIASDVGRTLVADYLRCLSYANVTDEKGRQEEIVMAFSQEERNLLRQFWSNNSALLSAAMSALAEDENFTDEERATFRKAGTAMSQKDYTKYRLAGSDATYSKRGIVEAVVREYLERHPNVTYEQFKRDFPDTLHTGGFSRTTAQGYAPNRFFAPVTLSDGTEIVYSNQWGVGNIEPFLATAAALGFSVAKV